MQADNPVYPEEIFVDDSEISNSGDGPIDSSVY